MVRPRTREALEAVREVGARVVVATGRMFASSRGYVVDAGIPDPFICYQGAVVADPQDGRFLRHEPIPLELAREAIAAVEAEGHPVEAFVDDRLHVAHETPETVRYSESRHVEAHVVGDLIAWLHTPPTKLVALGEARPLDRLSTLLKSRFEGRLAIAKSLPWLLELSSPEATKGHALAFVAEHLAFSLERTVAFGDGENDIGLFERAAYGVAVEGGDARLLARADFVCPPAEDEGVATVLEAYLDSRA